MQDFEIRPRAGLSPKKKERLAQLTAIGRLDVAMREGLCRIGPARATAIHQDSELEALKKSERMEIEAAEAEGLRRSRDGH